MISKVQKKNNSSKLLNFIAYMLRLSSKNLIGYEFLILLEAVQLLSFIYNCLHHFSKEDNKMGEFFSEFSTYFRVRYSNK